MNHNILITNPKGERIRHFEENKTLEVCQQFLKDLGSPPKGWLYQIINSTKKEPKKPEHILVQGFSQDGKLIAQARAGHKSNWGWYTIKMAKRDLRKQGAAYFTQEKVWDV